MRETPDQSEYARQRDSLRRRTNTEDASRLPNPNWEPGADFEPGPAWEPEALPRPAALWAWLERRSRAR